MFAYGDREMVKILILMPAKGDKNYQVMYDGDGPYTISSTTDLPVETVVEKLELNNPHATVEVEK